MTDLTPADRPCARYWGSDGNLCSTHHRPFRRGAAKCDDPTPADQERRSVTDAERFAANAILDRPSADPDDDPAIVARAMLRLAALPHDATGPARIVSSRRADPIVISESDFGPVHGAPHDATGPAEPLGVTPEEQVIRDWLDGQLSPSGSPLPPSRRRSQPLPRRQVTAVVATLIELLDEARELAALPHDATGPAGREQEAYDAGRLAGFEEGLNACDDATGPAAPLVRWATGSGPAGPLDVEGYWERAYWRVVPALAAALDKAGAPREDERLREAYVSGWNAAVRASQDDVIGLIDT